VPLEPARKESDVADVRIALGVCETDFRENVANGVPVEVLHAIPASLEDFYDLFGDCALPGARQPGKPQHRPRPAALLPIA